MNPIAEKSAHRTPLKVFYSSSSKNLVPPYLRQSPWKRLKRVAGPEVARPSTGAPITRGNSGNGVLLTRENRAGREQKS